MEGISAETSPGSFTCRTHVACRYVSLFFVHSTVRGPSSLASAGRVGWLMKKCSDSSSFILALFAAVRFDYPFKLGRKRLHLGNDSPVAVHRRIRKDSITSPRDGSRVHTHFSSHPPAIALVTSCHVFGRAERRLLRPPLGFYERLFVKTAWHSRNKTKAPDEL